MTDKEWHVGRVADEIQKYINKRNRKLEQLKLRKLRKIDY